MILISVSAIQTLPIVAIWCYLNIKCEEIFVICKDLNIIIKIILFWGFTFKLIWNLPPCFLNLGVVVYNIERDNNIHIIK